MTHGVYLPVWFVWFGRKYLEKQILMTFSGEVDNGPGNRWLRFGGVPDSGGTLTFDLRSQLALIIKHLLCYL